MFIVAKALLISNVTVIIRAGEPFGWNPLLQYYLMCVVPSLYSILFCTRVAWVCLVWLLS